MEKSPDNGSRAHYLIDLDTENARAEPERIKGEQLIEALRHLQEIEKYSRDQVIEDMVAAAKEQDWSALADYIDDPQASLPQDKSRIVAEIKEAPLEEALQLFQQLAMRGLITDEPAPSISSYNYLLGSLHDFKAAREIQTFNTKHIGLLRKGEDVVALHFATLNTEDTEAFRQGVIKSTLRVMDHATSTYSQIDHDEEQKARSVLYQAGLQPDLPLRELGYQVAEVIIDQLEESDSPLQQLDQLAQIDGQYIAGFIRSENQFGLEKSDMIKLLTRHDPEQVVHLAQEKIISHEEIIESLASTPVSPEIVAKLSVAAPEIVDDNIITALASQLRLPDLYQLALDSKHWRNALHHNTSLQIGLQAQLDTLLADQEGPVDKINALARFAAFKPVEPYIATRKEELFKELMGQTANREDVFGSPNMLYTASKSTIEETGIPGLSAVDQLQVRIRKLLNNDASRVNPIVFLETFESDIYQLKNNVSPSEKTKIVEAIIEWRKGIPTNPDIQKDATLDADTLSLASDLLSTATDLPSSQEASLYTDVLTMAHRYIDTRIAENNEASGDGIFDNGMLTAIATITKDQELIAKIIKHLSPESIDTTMQLALGKSDGQKALGWLQEVDIASRQAFLMRSLNPITASFVVDRAFPEDKHAQHETLETLAIKTNLLPVQIDQLQLLFKNVDHPDLPSTPEEAQLLLTLYHQLGLQSARMVLDKLPLYKFRGPHQETMAWTVIQGMRSGNVLLARFSLEHAELISSDPKNSEQWKNIQAASQSYITTLAETSARPEYLDDMSLLMRRGRADTTKTGKTIDRFDEHYEVYQNTMLRTWQSNITGMTNDQIDTALSSLTEHFVGSFHFTAKSGALVTLADLAHQGFLGKPLLEYMRHEKIIHEIMSSDAVVGESLKITDILSSANIPQTIEVLHHSAAELSSSRTEAERYAHIASYIVMENLLEEGGDERGSVLVPTPSGAVALSTITREDYEAYATNTLTEVLETPIIERNQARERNFRRAQLIQEEGSNFVIPQGSLIHETMDYDAILGSANLAGEHRGVSNLNTDSYPGFVDLIKTDGSWGQLTLGAYSEHPRRYTTTPGSALIYFPDANLTTQPETTSSHPGHHLAFAGINNTKLGLVIDLSDDEQRHEAARQAQVETGLYVPLVSRTGELLLTPEEFQERHDKLKQYRSIEDLVNAAGVYNTSLHNTPDPGGVGSIADHMERSVRITRDFIQQSELPDTTAKLVLAAMKLHDVGKTQEGAQEITNVAAARDILHQVDELTREEKRRILLLIRHDELLGEVLQNFELDTPSLQFGALPRYAQSKLDQFKRVFVDEDMRKAAIIAYQADVRAKHPSAWLEWQITDKLAAIGLPIYKPRTLE